MAVRIPEIDALRASLPPGSPLNHDLVLPKALLPGREVFGRNREGDVQGSLSVMRRNGPARQRHGLQRRPSLEEEQNASSGHVVGAKAAVLGERGETEHVLV